MSRRVFSSQPKAQAQQNRTKGGRFARNPKPSAIKLTVLTRQQTAEEGRQYTANLGLLLGEFVRKELDRGRKQL